MTFFIYKITNLKNNKIYIGKTNNPVKRWKKHNEIALGGKEKYPKHFYPIHAAISKYGKENFSFEIIEEFDDEILAYNAENKYVKDLMSNDSSIGYNIANGGGGVMTDRPVSLETRKKISIAQKGVKRRKIYNVSDEYRKKMSYASKNNKGLLNELQKKEIITLYNSGKFTKKQLSVKFNVKYETIRYVVNYYKNGFKTEEEKRINILTGNSKKRGQPLSKEHKKKLSESLKGIIFTKERKMNISKGLIGKIMSQETKDKIAAALSSKSNYLEIKKEIIDLFKTGNYTRVALAKKFNLNRKLVEKIIKQHNIKEKNDKLS